MEIDTTRWQARSGPELVAYIGRLLQLTQVVQALSQARTVDDVVRIVRQAGRALAGADGVTLVMRDGDQCHYVDEDAIAPLWKGRRFPMSACISGWVMLHRQAVAIADIYADDRIPHDAYRPTFVKSLVMVPIHSSSPIGAIGAYWAAPYLAREEDVRIVQALADSTAVALENVRIVRELEESRARTRTLYDHLPTATFFWRRQAAGFVLADLNEAARRATDGIVVSLLGAAPGALEDAIPGLETDLGACFADRAAVRREVECRLPGHRPQALVLRYGFVPPDGVILHAEDVTEQRRAEERLRLGQRLEAIGRLAGGVAHDFNNLLSAIICYGGFALEGLPPSDPRRADIQEVVNAGQRAAALTHQLLAFGRKQILEPELVDVNQVVASLEAMLRRLLGEHIDIDIHLARQLGRVMADPAQLEQVVVNLAVNARDAMPRGGALTIETADVELDEEAAAQHAFAAPGAFVVLAVSDTGHGMDAATRERIFEPFFTTKELGRGTGLGLATVYGIVKQSGGSIWVYSEPGRGSVFKVYLPRARAFAPAGRRRTSVSIARGSETVLLVEDEDAVRRLAERILRGAGYDVLSAASGPAALELCSERETIAILVSDVVMPKMSGPELAEQVCRRHPAAKVLYMSGYTDNAIAHHGVLDSGAHFLAKPFSAAVLARKVREVLDSE